MAIRPLQASRHPDPGTHLDRIRPDYVDYITELMGAFAIPGFPKKRLGLQYGTFGLRLSRASCHFSVAATEAPYTD